MSDYDRNKDAAEQLLASAAETKRGSDRERYLLDAAGVYATLALAAATREPWLAVRDRIKDKQEQLDAAFHRGLSSSPDRYKDFR